MTTRPVRLEALEAVLWLVGAPGHPPPEEAKGRTFYTDLVLELEQAIAGGEEPGLADKVAGIVELNDLLEAARALERAETVGAERAGADAVRSAVNRYDARHG